MIYVIEFLVKRVRALLSLDPFQLYIKNILLHIKNITPYLFIIYINFNIITNKNMV